MSPLAKAGAAEREGSLETASSPRKPGLLPREGKRALNGIGKDEHLGPK